jgi:hypothetical protein
MDDDSDGNRYRFRPDAQERARFLPDHPMDPLLAHIAQAKRLAVELEAATLVYLLGLCEDHARELAGFRDKGTSPVPPSGGHLPDR